ncbi:MAG: hypothetical protein FWG64_08770 [Firmicutes bacterium]|nr:hypothetical protein [Bacillota bacterium]
MQKVNDRILTNVGDVMMQYPDKFVVFERIDDDEFMQPGYMLFICDSYKEALSVRSDVQKDFSTLLSVAVGEDWWNVI